MIEAKCMPLEIAETAPIIVISRGRSLSAPNVSQRDREREQRALEAKSATESFRSRLSSAHEELETVREALLQSNAETRR